MPRGKSGQTGCRLSYEQPLQECTDVCQLDAGLTPPENIQPPLEKDYSQQALPTPDRRMFFWQIKRATLQSIPAANEDPRPICCSQAIEDDPYVFIPFGSDEQMQFRNFLDDWYAKDFCSKILGSKQGWMRSKTFVQKNWM